MRRSLWPIETRMLHSSGMGKVNITISLSMLPAEWIYHWKLGMQVALASFSQ